MPKTVTCPVKGFSGPVTFHEPLFYEQVAAYEEAQDTASVTEIEDSKYLASLRELLKTLAEKEDKPFNDFVPKWSSKSDYLLIPAIVLCVKEWDIEGLEKKPAIQTFPMTPRKQASEFVSWLWEEITKIYRGEVAIPNE